MKHLILYIVCMIGCLSFNSCVATDVPVVSTSSVQVVYPYVWHRQIPPPPPRRPVYVCPPPRDPYKPIWQQRPSIRPRFEGFGNMNRRSIDRPRKMPDQRNKNFGRGR